MNDTVSALRLKQQKGVIAQPLTTRARLGEGISIQEDSRSVCARRAPLLVTHLRAGRGEPDDVWELGVVRRLPVCRRSRGA